MRKIKFIVNPVAGKGIDQATLELIHKKMKAAGLNYSVAFSNYKGDVENIAKKSIKENFTDIIAVGGDGTLLEAFNGVFSHDVVLGILPTGTGNDFLRMLGLNKNLDHDLDKIIQGSTRTIDTGLVNDSHFLNVVGMGIDGEIVQKTENVKKIIKGPAAYLYSTFSSLVSYKCKKIRIIIDGQSYDREVYLVAVGNGKYFGGGMKITPGAEIDNESFEVVIINKMPKWKFTILFRKVFSGTHVGEDVVEVFQGKNIQILTSDNFKINADGNIIGQGNCKIELLPKSQKIIV